MTPSPADLKYFLEVANVLNLSRAAESLGISQPSLTLAIKRLEKSVGTAILVRHKRGVTLSKAGKQLLAHTRCLLQYWESIKLETLAAVDDIQGCISIGCHPSIAHFSLPLFLPDLLTQYPKLEVKLEHQLSRKITEQVINLSIDIGIVVNPVKHQDLIIKKIDDDKFTLWEAAASKGNQSLKNRKTIILCDPNLFQTQSILKSLKKQKIEYGRIIPSDNLEVIAELTKSGCGIGILPGSVAHLYKLACIPKMPVFHDEICLLYRGENRQVKSIQVISEAIKTAFKKGQDA